MSTGWRPGNWCSIGLGINGGRRNAAVYAMGSGHRSYGIAELLARVARGEGLTGQERAELELDGGARGVAEAFRRVGLNSRQAPEDRMALLRRSACLCPTCALRVDGRAVETRVTLEELWRFYLPLCAALGAHACRPGAVRSLIGIAGPPGGGKSTFCALVERLFDVLSGRCGAVVTVSLDGFHYPNAYLDGHGLRAAKGAPETYDVGAFVDALDRLLAEPCVELLSYDRVLHDPVPAATRVAAAHRLVLVEGNYLLLAEGRWKAVRPKLDLVAFLRVPLESIRPFIIERHVQGGRPRPDAESHFRRVDRANYERCMRSARRADFVVERTPDQCVGEVSGQH